MKAFKSGYVLAVTLASALNVTAHATPVLQTINGIVGGAGSCGSFVPAPELAFFSFAPADVPVCGITASGYSGGYRTQTATAGTLTQHDSLAPVVLGPPLHAPGFYSGTADSRASVGSLGAAAHSEINHGVPESPTALFDSVAAATFSDTITATSPLVATTSGGMVRYRFEVDGSLSAPGLPGPALFGESYMVLDVQHGSGPVYEVMNASLVRGGLGKISNRSVPSGWVTSPGSLSGGSAFLFDMPIVWGQPWDVTVGLLAWSYGTADTDFFSTARLTGLELFDANGAQITDFSLRSASGASYANAVPEPSAAVLLMAGLLGVALLRGRRRR